MSSPPRTGAPELTEAMIESGLNEFRSFRYDFDDEREVIVRIWEAMWEAALNKQLQSD